MARAPSIEYRRRVPAKLVAPICAALGAGLLIAAMAIPGHDAARTGLLAGFGGLIIMIGAALFVDRRRKLARDERVRICDDHLEVATTAGTTAYPFADLQALEGKVIVVQQTGARIHAYRLVFPRAQVELVGDAFLGVDASTGQLLADRTGRRIDAWL